MCMIFGHSIPPARRGAKGPQMWSSFVATDTRVMLEGGGHADPGGKVVSTGSGWATGAGLTYEPFHASLTALGAAGSIPLSTDPATGKVWPGCDVIARAERTVSQALSAPGLAGQKGTTILVIEPCFGVLVMRDGKADEWWHIAGVPFDLEGEHDSRTAAMLQSIGQAGEDLASRIQSAAEHFYDASCNSNNMSDTMEIGYLVGFSRGFLRGKAREIAKSKANEILLRFQAEPREQLPPRVIELPRTSVAAERASYTKVVSGVSGQITPPSSVSRFRARVYASGNFSISHSTPQILAWNQHVYDVGGLHSDSVANTKIFIPAGGDIRSWRITAHIEWAANGAGSRQVSIIKNGLLFWPSSVVAPVTGGGVTTQEIIAEDDSPSVGDYYEIQVLQTSGGALNVNGSGPNGSTFSARHEW